MPICSYLLQIPVSEYVFMQARSALLMLGADLTRCDVSMMNTRVDREGLPGGTSTFGAAKGNAVHHLHFCHG